MRRRAFLKSIAAGAAVAGSATGLSQAATQEEPPGGPIPPLSVEKRGRFNGRELRYTVLARADTVSPVGSSATAELFSYTYLAQQQAKPAARPVIFCFNGGPGASSASLHLSGLGPRRIRFGDSYDGAALLARLPLIESEVSVLDSADLVFVDPPGTGYSRGVLRGATDAFWSTREDSRACSDFIRIWLARHDRWESPLYLMGESYGTVRVALLTRDLMGGVSTGELPAIPVAGVMLVSCVENRTQLFAHPTNDSYYQAYLPTFAATALYHGRGSTGRSLPELIEDVRRFTIETYGPALYLGAHASSERREAVTRALATYTGLPAAFITRAGQRVTLEEFAGRLLEDKGLRIGKYDTRTVIANTVGMGDTESDPSMTQLQQAFGVAIGEYLTGELQLEAERPFRMINFVANAYWKTDFPDSADEYSDVSPLLARAMAVNPRMRLMTHSGYYDLDAPFMGVEHTFQNPLFPQERVAIRHYESGHMCYVGERAVHAFANDVRHFVQGAG